MAGRRKCPSCGDGPLIREWHGWVCPKGLDCPGAPKPKAAHELPIHRSKAESLLAEAEREGLVMLLSLPSGVEISLHYDNIPGFEWCYMLRVTAPGGDDLLSNGIMDRHLNREDALRDVAALSYGLPE